MVELELDIETMGLLYAYSAAEGITPEEFIEELINQEFDEPEN